MTPLWTAAEAAAATGGTLQGDWTAAGLSSDSRTVRRGDLFVALADRLDGHDFVAEALVRGAAAALVSRRPDGVAADAPLLVVPDTLEALRGLARAARARSGARVIGITGSVGKTGTKEMLRAGLAGQGRVHAALKSFNNHFGVPLTLAALPREAEFAVIEIGMNHAGEIAPLARLARLHVAVVTTVAAVHLENFGSVAGIAAAKAEIFQGLEPGGTAILNRDIASHGLLARAARARGARILTFGAGGRPAARLVEVQTGPRSTQIAARLHGRPILFKLGAPGRHLAPNALAVLLAAEAAGADPVKAALALAGWRPPAGRGARWRVELEAEEPDASFLLIDESYNANPTSVGAALDLLADALPANGIGRVARGRRIAVLGDMLELGPEELALHAALATHPAMAALDRVHCTGPRMQALHRALPPRIRGEWFPDSAALAARIPRLVDAGDVVMVKGSLGARMGPVVERLKALGPAREDQAGAEDS